MTLRSFLDAAYAVIVDDFRKHGSGLMEALESNELWRAGGPGEIKPSSGEQVPPAVERKIERENAQALSELQKMMAGVSFGGAAS